MESIQDMNVKFNMKREALKYASMGFSVLPLHTLDEYGYCSCGDSQCSHVGKHPHVAGGYQSATKDADKISVWWDKWPEANIGIATGKISNCVVLDFDFPKGGMESLKAYREEYGKLKNTPVALTGNGVHLYYRCPDFEVKRKINLMAGLDVIGESSYVVAPPSLHYTGKRYSWRMPLGGE